MILDTRIEIPVAVRAGISRKLSDAFRMPVDGHPSTQGTPLEADLRYYYKYNFCDSDLTFEAFLVALSRDLKRIYPDLDFTLDWARKCDAMSRIAAARKSVYQLRAYVRTGKFLKISFWDILWDLTEVSIKTFGVRYDDIDMDEQEVRSLSRRYLVTECGARVEALKAVEKRAGARDAEKAFRLVDQMLNGIPVPREDFCRNSRTHYSPCGAYQAYRKAASGTVISHEEVGWSLAEHLACKTAIFPQGYEPDMPVVSCPDPTAPATAEREEKAVEFLVSAAPRVEERAEPVMVKSDRSPARLLESWFSRASLMPFAVPALQGA